MIEIRLESMFEFSFVLFFKNSFSLVTAEISYLCGLISTPSIQVGQVLLSVWARICPYNCRYLLKRMPLCKKGFLRKVLRGIV